jgi:hypothetical protein
MSSFNFTHSLKFSLFVGVPLAQFWSISARFWVDFGTDGELRISEMRFYSLSDFQSDGRRVSETVDVLNTVRAIQVRQAHDATWEPCLALP